MQENPIHPRKFVWPTRDLPRGQSNCFVIYLGTDDSLPCFVIIAARASRGHNNIFLLDPLANQHTVDWRHQMNGKRFPWC
jgi:hypothetical protein